MIETVKKYLMPFMVIYSIFMGVIGNSIQILTGALESSSIDHRLAIVFAVMSMILFIYDVSKGYVLRKEIGVLIVLFVVLGLYAAAPSFYGEHWKHMSYMLVFLSESIPAAYIGMRAARTKDMEKVNDLLPLFVIPTSLLIGTLGLKYAEMGERMNNDDSGLNYQSLSYIMSFAYAYSAYYVFFCKRQFNNIFGTLIKIVMIFMTFYCALVTLTGGGRGAFVYTIFITVMFVYYYIRHSEGHGIRNMMIICVMAAAVIWMIDHYSVMSSAGMERVMGRLMDDDNREVLYNLAYDAFTDSPFIGHGIGSIWWKVGWYSHNMFMDLLVEVGIIGTSIISIFIVGIMLKLYRYTKMDNIYIFLAVLFMSALIRYSFTGYWMSAVRLFMVCSWVYCLPKLK